MTRTRRMEWLVLAALAMLLQCCYCWQAVGLVDLSPDWYLSRSNCCLLARGGPAAGLTGLIADRMRRSRTDCGWNGMVHAVLRAFTDRLTAPGVSGLDDRRCLESRHHLDAVLSPFERGGGADQIEKGRGLRRRRSRPARVQLCKNVQIVAMSTKHTPRCRTETTKEEGGRKAFAA